MTTPSSTPLVAPSDKSRAVESKLPWPPPLEGDHPSSVVLGSDQSSRSHDGNAAIHGTDTSFLFSLDPRSSLHRPADPLLHTTTHHDLEDGCCLTQGNGTEPLLPQNVPRRYKPNSYAPRLRSQTEQILDDVVAVAVLLAWLLLGVFLIYHHTHQAGK